ncbi:ATP-grasp domain-containing protein [Mycobacterium antarcticum]|uniref:ATP-grasp domain-containing protein n=1 Tax=Mycolicibacterium sp. TUM20984 TaxID=3023368 RepID=UPI00239A40CD|nr:ATP-grasp domain-containing protein [Mycolicibacterium sp. TUM20984]GLP81759.1 phosphoribosylglycinamide formyltransferase 2 [Mycolicibacterium sp. TUM20984]
MSEASGSERPRTVLLLGAGDAGPELALAFERLGVAVTRVEQCPEADAVGALLDEHRPDYVIAVSADVSAAVLIAAAERESVEVFPTPRAVRLGADREGLRKLAGDELGLPTVPFWFASSAEELAAVADHAGFPLVVTPLTGTVADGQSVLTRPDDVEPAWKRAFATGPAWSNRVMAETVVEVDDEVTLLTVRTTEASGPAVQFCEPIGHRKAGAGPLETWQPHRLSLAALDAARSIAARIVHSLGGRGVFAVELLVHGDEVYFATVDAQPLETGLITLRSQRLSYFELHARAILGLSVDTIMISPAAAEVGTRRTGPGPALAEALDVPESDVRLLDATSVAIATAPDVVRARDRAHRVSTVVHGLGS